MKGMIMGSESVRAILDGRKTQTRRVVKPQPLEGSRWVGWLLDSTGMEDDKRIGSACWRCDSIGGDLYVKPRYKVGEIVYVKEVFAYWKDESQCIAYQADNNHFDFTNRIGWEDEINIEDISKKGKWESPYFMPEWASRIHLEITGIKAQRVQDITEEEAMAEGIEKPIEERCMLVYRDYSIKEEDNEGYNWFSTAKDSYSSLWDSINAKKGFPWEASPWVFAYTFKVVEEGK